MPNAQIQRAIVRIGHWSLRLGHSLVIGRWSLVISLWSFPSLASPATPGAELFTNGTVHRFQIEISPAEAAKLRQNPRANVSAVVREGTNLHSKTGVHLKGSTGSFRKLDDKPGFTLNFGKFTPGQTLHGLRKIHLNNSVEDPSYLNDLLGSELFRAAGVPAPRTAHALVELNGRRLGLYVLKEGFTEDFLGNYFHHTNGKLYESGPGHDADEPLKLLSGSGEDDQGDLKTLAAAAREPDLQKRWQRLEKLLDVERFLSFMAMEVMACHRDGYCLARNNFRIYHNLDTDRMVFFPHGMDQLFGKFDAPIEPRMNGLIARSVLETSEGHQQYRQRLVFLLTNAFDVPTLTGAADRTLAKLRAVLPASEARVLEGEVATVKERISRRRADLERQLSKPELRRLRFENGIAQLAGWQIVDPPAGGLMEQTKSADGPASLRIRAGPATSASWRTTVRLYAGRYRFEGAVSTTAVEPLNYGKNHGAGLRVTGFPRREPGNLTGDRHGSPLQVEFQVGGAEQDVELVCELRARAGEARFDLDSLRLVRLNP